MSVLHVDQQLYVGVLKLLSKEMAIRIFERSPLPLGVQIVFNHHWSEWIQTVHHIGAANALAANVVEANAVAAIEPIQPIANSSNLQTNNDHLDLNMILKCAPYGPAVLDFYKSHNKLDDNTRKLLVEAFLHYCITANIKPSKADCKKVAETIAKTLNGEIAVKIYMCLCYILMCCPQYMFTSNRIYLCVVMCCIFFLK